MTEKKTPKITVAPDGPYVVTDLERLQMPSGQLESKPTMALCRCGASKNKPFCDGQHKKVGFKSD